MAALFFVKCNAKPLEKLFFLSFYLLLIGNFYKSAADYPLVCTMNFRYITPTVITGALFTALFLKKSEQNKSGKIAVLVMETLTSAFVLCSAAVYLTAGLAEGE